MNEFKVGRTVVLARPCSPYNRGVKGTITKVNRAAHLVYFRVTYTPIGCSTEFRVGMDSCLSMSKMQVVAAPGFGKWFKEHSHAL